MPDSEMEARMKALEGQVAESNRLTSENNRIITEFLNAFKRNQLAPPEEIHLAQFIEALGRLNWPLFKVDKESADIFTRQKFYDRTERLAQKRGWVEKKTTEAERTWFVSENAYLKYLETETITATKPKGKMESSQNSLEDLHALATIFLKKVEMEGTGNLEGWINEQIGWDDHDNRRNGLRKICSDLILNGEWYGRVRNISVNGVKTFAFERAVNR